ncbi:type II toxin-antitoxin system RelE/ParE family toxin [Polaribacter sp.]|uniref:type II toxin-antitoxin system RelE/ParE family toxin n=1 Tax=Polaribacter sp. TaxID=1920175 RepID=UPI004047E4F9
MYKYKLSFEAEEDIIRIFEYGVHQFGFAQASKYYELLFSCFEKIASNPMMFPKVKKYENIERFCVCGADTIFYMVQEDKIEIITIVGRQQY